VIYGIGTDIVEIARIHHNLEKHGQGFAERILAEPEFEAYQRHQQKAHFLAKRYAAKEAVAKAFGTGFRDGLSLRHIIVMKDTLGKPELCFESTAKMLAQQHAICGSHLSLSDEQNYAIAFVVLEAENVELKSSDGT